MSRRIFCRTCEKPLMLCDGNADECFNCCRSEKCSHCGYPLSVENGNPFCSKCDPLLYAATYQTSASRVLLIQGRTVDTVKNELFGCIQFYTGTEKRTYTIWKQTYYGPRTDESRLRIWRKVMTMTVQNDFRENVAYTPDLDKYARGGWIE